MELFKRKTIYLDYAGAAPIEKKVLKEMEKYEDFYSNPSAIYQDGVSVRKVIEEARKNIAKEINAHSDEIIFTGSGTESDALAVLGVARAWRKENEEKIPHIITSRIEHPAILENCRLLEKNEEAEVTYIDVDNKGIIKLEELEESIKDNTVLVSIMYANNEIGTIEPIEEVARIIRRYKKEHKTIYPLFHTDAAQAMNYLFTSNVEKLGVDMMSFNSSKIYGPKGIGILYKKRNINLFPLYEGGGQEFGLRSGTENISLIVGVSKALEITNEIKEKELERLTKIRDYGIEKILNLSKESGYRIILNGDKINRLPNNINISVFGISSELLVIELSAKGIFVSEKSACKSEDENKSYVISAIRKICPKDQKETDGSLRISMGRFTEKGDIDQLVLALKDIFEKYKKWK